MICKFNILLKCLISGFGDKIMRKKLKPISCYLLLIFFYVIIFFNKY